VAEREHGGYFDHVGRLTRIEAARPDEVASVARSLLEGGRFLRVLLK